MPNDNEGVVYTNPPQSRNEAILESGISGTPYTAPPQSRIEDLLIQLINTGGGGGTTVIANPEETGNEENLGGLQVGNNKFKVLEIGEVLASAPQAKKPSLVVSANDELSYKPDTTNYILLYCDDARTDLPDAWEIISEYGIPINLAVPSDHLNYNCNNGKKMYELLHEMEDAGCEILSHACSEADILTDNSTKAQAYEWLKKSKEALLAEGYRVNGFCEPG